MKIGAVILAAGYSSRMGGFKPLMSLGGKTLLSHCAGVFTSSGLTSITVVTGYRGQEVEAEAVRLGLRNVTNREYDQGMFSSICRALTTIRQLDAFFLLPVDTPLLYPATVSTLVECFDGESVLLPVFAGERGHPPLIPAQMIPDILTHDGKGGLRSALDSKPCREIEVWDKGVVMDADVRDDFSALEKRWDTIGVGEPDEALAMARLFMPAKGVAHGSAVAQLGEAMGRRLNRQGCALNLQMIHNGALLHDIAKGSEQHEARGSLILKQQGLGRLAPIVAAHRSVSPPPTGNLSEKEIVCLADKFVKGSRFVSVEERFADKLALYLDDIEACHAIRRRLADSLALQEMVEQQAGCSIQSIIEGIGRT